MLFTNNVYAYEVIEYNDYKIQIKKITLEYYARDGYMEKVDSIYKNFIRVVIQLIYLLKKQ